MVEGARQRIEHLVAYLAPSGEFEAVTGVVDQGMVVSKSLEAWMARAFI